jgi:hypothetical protein
MPPHLAASCNLTQAGVYLNDGLVAPRIVGSSGVDIDGNVRHIARDLRVPPQFMDAPQTHDWKWVALSLQNKGHLVSEQLQSRSSAQ